ncbi:hypothetical protein J3R82DRAFT_8885 [Butyriboletus roseoflavus]|nr:hypothetical protein J3R82DRAFT_8885 [Butyriboletus roseoflavus]
MSLFNIGHNGALNNWHSQAAKLMASLSRYRHVIIFVTIHSDPNTSDLWLRQDEHGDTCAAMWLEDILRPFKAILNGCILFMLACGAMVNNSKSLAGLRQGLTSLGVGDALTFDVKYLSTMNTMDLLMKVTKSVIIHSFEFSQALEHFLKQCMTLGRHTSIIHFVKHIIKYSWAHWDYQLWGQTLPLQCPQCGILDPWASVLVKQIQGYRLECKNQDCGKADVILSAGREHGGCASRWLKLIIS